MGKLISNNYFWLLFIILWIMILSFIETGTVIKDILIFIIIYVVVIAIHETGHLFFGKLFNFKTGMMSNIFGIFINGKWYFNTTVLLSLGYTVMYKNKEIKKKEYILFFLGGIIFNILSICILISPLGKYIYYRDFFLISNIVIILMTSLPIEGTDLFSIKESIKNWKKEKSNFEKYGIKFNYLITSEECIEKTKNNEDEYFKSINDLSKLEIKSRTSKGIFSINEYSLYRYEDEYIEAIVLLFYSVICVRKNKELTNDIAKQLKKINYSHGPLVYYLKMYVKTKKSKYVHKVKKYKYQAPGIAELRILNNILKD